MSQNSSKRSLLKELLSGETTSTNLQDVLDGAVFVARDRGFTRNGKPITEAQYNARHPSCLVIQLVRFKKTMAE